MEVDPTRMCALLVGLDRRRQRPVAVDARQVAGVRHGELEPTRPPRRRLIGEPVALLGMGHCSLTSCLVEVARLTTERIVADLHRVP